MKVVGKTNFICERCRVSFPYAVMYEHITTITKIVLNICKQCAYKESFGTKNWRKKMKEGVLDG
jgi:protein-arginine kinase activator protein McsA